MVGSLHGRAPGTQQPQIIVGRNIHLAMVAAILLAGHCRHVLPARHPWIDRFKFVRNCWTTFSRTRTDLMGHHPSKPPAVISCCVSDVCELEKDQPSQVGGLSWYI